MSVFETVKRSGNTQLAQWGAILVAWAALVCLAGCGEQEASDGVAPDTKAQQSGRSDTKTKTPGEPLSKAKDPAADVVDAPVTQQSRSRSVGGSLDEAKEPDSDEIPLFGANSPFEDDYEPPEVRQEKRLWARSCLYDKAPELVVEKWLGEMPKTEGKYVLIEFWATWCGPCRRSLPLLNEFHRKYGKELVVIGISHEPEEDVLGMEQPGIEFYSAIDTQARMKEQLAVEGIPHTIIVEPDGYVVWEGFPLQEGYELTAETIEKILAVGRELRAESAG